MARTKRIPLAGVVSLGCSKNLVDTEYLVGGLGAGGWGLVPERENADLLLVNTCAFIGPAVEESHEAIAAAVAWKAKRAGRLVVVAGCMVNRFADELATRYPAVDLLLAPKQIPRLGEWLALQPPRPLRLGSPGRAFLPSGSLDRSLTTGPWAYLKISDGCSNCCHYCLIPSIRGPHASRTRAAVLDEARALIDAGVRELNLVGQDITRFGEGRRGGGLAPLVRAVAALPGDFRVRLLYLHPERVDEEIIGLFAETPKLCAYLDIPIQHASGRVLERMNRRYARRDLERLFSTLRERIPGVALRTTVMVGYPGEGKREFAELLSFLRAHPFENLGAFVFSAQPGTKAATHARRRPRRGGRGALPRRDDAAGATCLRPLVRARRPDHRGAPARARARPHDDLAGPHPLAGAGSRRADPGARPRRGRDLGRGARHRRRGLRPRGEDRLTVSSAAWHRVLYPGLLLFGLSLALSKSAGNVLLGALYLSALAGAAYSKEFRDDVVRSCRQPLTAAMALFSLVAYAGIIHTEKYADGFASQTSSRACRRSIFSCPSCSSPSRDEEAGARKAESLLFSFLAGLTALNLLGVLTFLGVVGDAAFALPLSPLGMHHIWYSNLNALGLYTAAALLLFSRRGTSARGRALLGGFLLLSTLGVLLSTSRTSWFGIALTAAIMAAATIRRKRTILIAAAPLRPGAHRRVSVRPARSRPGRSCRRGPRPVLRRPTRGVLASATGSSCGRAAL